MFRYLIPLFLLLAGCHSPTSPRIVKMPELGSEYVKKIHADCEWQNADISVFSQKDQRVTFRYEYCERQKLTEFKYQDTLSGGKLIPQYEVGISPTKITILGIWKLGPDSPNDFLQSYLAQHNSKESCELLKMRPYVYKVIDSGYRNLPGFKVIEHEPPNEFLARIDRYSDIHKIRWRYATKCGGLGQRNLIFKDGIIFSIASASINYYIDYTSVTYESRG